MATLDIDILVVGFGYTSFSLLNELERTKHDYVIVSSGPTLFNRLSDVQCLDFDTVSGTFSSFYTFDMVGSNNDGSESSARFPEPLNKHTKGSWPTAKEFYASMCRLSARFKHRVVEDWVTRIDNHDDHSYICLQSGNKYRAKHVILATGYAREINKSLTDFDYRACFNKTVVIKSIGDSANLLCSKLVPNNNRVICVANGLVAYDKALYESGVLNSLEDSTHGIWDSILPQLYKHTILGGGWLTQGFPDNLATAVPEAWRTDWWSRLASTTAKAGIPNGLLVTKYWGIDTYSKLFGDDLEAAIRKGYLCNDIAFLLSEGLVELWPSRTTSIDREHKTIAKDQTVLPYDHIIDTSRERPNLPPIFFSRDGESCHRFEYVHRDNYLGVVSPKLCNIYFCGLTRPTTGGIAVPSEMQGLLIHKLVTNALFNERIYAELPKRIFQYNLRQYGEQISLPCSPFDHLVHADPYVRDVAIAIGIDLPLSTCRTLLDVQHWFWGPLRPYRFRQRGEYCINGASELSKQHATENFQWVAPQMWFLSYVFTLLSLYALGLAAWGIWGLVPLYALVFYLLAMYQLGTRITSAVLVLGWTAVVNSIFYKPLRILIIGLLLTVNIVSISHVSFLGLLIYCALCVLPPVKLYPRMPFHGMRNKGKYHAFWQRYCDVYRATQSVMFTEKSKNM
ncbi:hypothetical protein CYMTET_25556 [Cymbomonas tetramitiformis]|uniref:Uncharacterized protein n=1 Tax=Cymbomonas tetramitiformis TaxID=36881 RepID=A0AAE0KZ48_9CHLO|nr:hypothetical protein CYMTET_25556 [Cymbomonas tetramitiformis]|eukprot:gene22511-27165_t